MARCLRGGVAQGGNVSNGKGRSPAFLELTGFDGLTAGNNFYTSTSLGANDAEQDVYRRSFQVVLEPESLALMLPGLLAIGWVGRKRRKPGAEAALSPE